MSQNKQTVQKYMNAFDKQIESDAFGQPYDRSHSHD
jgi:hypothetical protein